MPEEPLGRWLTPAEARFVGALSKRLREAIDVAIDEDAGSQDAESAEISDVDMDLLIWQALATVVGEERALLLGMVPVEALDFLWAAQTTPPLEGMIQRHTTHCRASVDCGFAQRLLVELKRRHRELLRFGRRCPLAGLPIAALSPVEGLNMVADPELQPRPPR